jgi:hypothetical protein
MNSSCSNDLRLEFRSDVELEASLHQRKHILDAVHPTGDHF